jgi:hypothetical protein
MPILGLVRNRELFIGGQSLGRIRQKYVLEASALSYGGFVVQNPFLIGFMLWPLAHGIGCALTIAR